MMAMTAAASTFVAQNLGAGYVKRARQGVRYTMYISLASTVILSAVVLLFAKNVVGIFTADAQVLEIGTQFLRVFVPAYFLLCFTQILPGALRGAGQVRFPMFTCLGCFVVFRQIYLFAVTKIHFTPVTVALGYPLAWAICAVIMFVYYIKSDWSSFEGTI
jgi:Na+-driven multidrug efflux pump